MLVTNYHTRVQWGAAPPRKAPTNLPMSQVERIFLHYTGSNADEQADHANCPARVRGVQRYHQSPTPSDPSKPWNDIAYSFVVCKHGHVFQGRGFGVRTAATGPCNDDSLAIVFLGDDSASRDDVTDLGRDAIAEIVAEIETRRGKRLPVKGHRDCMSTACPGNQLHRWINTPAFRKLVEAQKSVKPKYEWYIAAGGKVLMRAGNPAGLARKIAAKPTPIRAAILASKHDRGTFGRRKRV